MPSTAATKTAASVPTTAVTTTANVTTSGTASAASPLTGSSASSSSKPSSTAAAPAGTATTTMSSSQHNHHHHAKPAKLVPFLRKVQQLCETAPSHIARWSADGKQFDVLDPKGFDDLLKVHFEGAAPATFHRQLFFYGWVKLNHSNGGGDEKTKGTWSFRHPCFLRDEPSKIYEIKRYARASDREEQEDGSRVDILERRVSALQSLVDDLSRKLAAVTLALERTPLPVSAEQPVHEVSVEKPGRKRLKDIDEDFLNGDLRLSEDDILSLFEDGDTSASTSFFMEEDTPSPIQTKQSPYHHPMKMSEDQQAQQAQEFLSTLMSTPQFHAAITSTIQEKPTPKVESLPHLSVC